MSNAITKDPRSKSAGSIETYDERYLFKDMSRGGSGRLCLTEDGYALLEEVGTAGHDIYTVSEKLGISHTTFAAIRKRDQRAADAFKRGRAKLGNEINDLLLTQARDGNTTAMIFIAKGRLGWREVGPTDGDEAGAGPSVNITINAPLSDDEFRKMVEINPTPPKEDDE